MLHSVATALATSVLPVPENTIHRYCTQLFSTTTNARVVNQHHSILPQPLSRLDAFGAACVPVSSADPGTMGKRQASLSLVG